MNYTGRLIHLVPYQKKFILSRTERKLKITDRKNEIVTLIVFKTFRVRPQ